MRITVRKRKSLRGSEEEWPEVHLLPGQRQIPLSRQTRELPHTGQWRTVSRPATNTDGRRWVPWNTVAIPRPLSPCSFAASCLGENVAGGNETELSALSDQQHYVKPWGSMKKLTGRNKHFPSNMAGMPCFDAHRYPFSMVHSKLAVENTAHRFSFSLMWTSFPLKRCLKAGHGGMSLIPADLCEFKAGLVYIMSSRTVKSELKDCVSYKQHTYTRTKHTKKVRVTVMSLLSSIVPFRKLPTASSNYSRSHTRNAFWTTKQKVDTVGSPFRSTHFTPAGQKPQAQVWTYESLLAQADRFSI